MCSGVRAEGWLRWLAHPSGGAVCREPAKNLLLLLALQKRQLGFLVSLSLVVHNLPH